MIELESIFILEIYLKTTIERFQICTS